MLDHDNNYADHRPGIGGVKIRPIADAAAEPHLAHGAIPTDVSLKGGKEGGEVEQLPPLPPSNAEFVAAVVVGVADGARAAICSISGEPASNWPAQVADDIDEQCPPGRNNYLNCSSFTLDGEGAVRAILERFSALHFVLLDDVGTKVEETKLDGFTPTWKIETSPGNFQVGIKLTVPIRDRDQGERLLNAIMAAGLSDKGAGGLARWARLPNAINGKAKHQDEEGVPFRCRLAALNADVSYTIEELTQALSLDMAPPLPPIVPAHRRHGGAALRGDDVFTPRPLENPVLTALKNKSLHKRQIEAGKHDITCPWVDEHTDKMDGGTAYFEPSADYPTGGFKCQHSHGDRYHIGDLLRELDIEPAAAHGKPSIRMINGAIGRVVRAAEQVLATSGNFYQSGGMILIVRKDARSGAISTEVVNEQTLTTILSDAAHFERFDGRSKTWVPSDPAQRVVQMLMKGGDYKYLPFLKGIARQPFMREEDLGLVTEPGYDPVSGIYADFDPADYSFPEPTLEAACEAKRALIELLSEFEFATDADRSATLSAMLTATVRPTLPLAPAYNITASAPGSGKSYLARTIVPFATPADAFTTGYPTTAEEASKAMLAALLQGPAAIVFDDMQTEWRPFAAINRALTSETITERILGVSRTASVSTRALFLGTGNNVGPVGDMTRRVITIRLYAQTENPAMRSFRGRPVDELRMGRGRFVSHALTIMRAWIAAGKPRADVPDIASYDGLWNDLCRQPLLWMGEADPATSLIDQVQDDPYLDPLGDLLHAWHAHFGDRSVTVRKVISAAADDPALEEALEDLPAMERGHINPSSLGWYLKKNAQRIVGGLEIRHGDSSERKSWRVVKVPLEGGKGG